MTLQPIMPIAHESTLPTPVTRILIVDDHPLIRRVVRETLEEEPGFIVCAEAADDASARQLIASAKPHLALIDLSLGESSGIDLIKWLAAAFPAIRIVVLSMHDESLYAAAALRAGAHAYVNKRDAPTDMIDTIRNIMAGNIHVDPRFGTEKPASSVANPRHPN